MTTTTCTSPASAIARSALLLALLAGSAHAAAPAVTISPARDMDEAGLVDIRTLAPGIEQDIRYAGPDNFTGQRVPGYDAPKCYLLAPAATALVQVATDLRPEGFALRIFDCYRAAHAVTAFVAWAHDPKEQSRKAQQYPDIDKPALLGDYIAETSGHSRAATVDLTLLDCRSGSCAPVDMGSDFDFFGPRAHTDAPEISAAQSSHRQQLRQAMARRGFANYPMEWGHFTLQPEPAPSTAYDVPVR